LIASETWIFPLSECLKWCREGGTWKDNQLDLIEKRWEIRSCTFEINFLVFFYFVCVFLTENRFDEMTWSYLAFLLWSHFFILILENPWIFKSSHQYSTIEHIVNGIFKRIEEKTFPYFFVVQNFQ
jgi:hypothetical protein